PFFMLAATPTEPQKSSATSAQHCNICAPHAVRFSDHACEGFAPKNVRARIPKTPGVVPRPA
ncbi:MAG: hypothetical protein ACRD41_01700, partial [Candidatus Acidiferrales bacterium]